MPLIACRVCGQPVSDSALFCPHCGKELPGPLGSAIDWLWNFMMKAVLVGVVLLVVGSCIAALAG